MVSNGVVISFYTLLVAMITVPIMLAILIKIRTKVKFSPFFLGMLSYFTFAVVCTAFVNIIFVNKGRPTADFINSNVIIYSLYFAIVTGILEELGIFVVFKKILVSHDDKRTSLIYALGHAGLDAFLIAGPTLFLYITCSAAINELGVEGFKSEWADVQTFDLQNVIDTLTGFSVGDVLLMGFDRIVFFIMHIFLSIMVFYAVKREAKVYFWIAVIIRGLCTVPGSLRNFGSYTGGAMETVIMYVYVVVIVAILGFMSVKLYKSYDNTERILMPKDLFTQSRNTLM